MGFLIDLGHLNVTVKSLNFNRMKFIRNLITFIGTMHIQDNNGYEDLHHPITEESWVLNLMKIPEFNILSLKQNLRPMMI